MANVFPPCEVLLSEVELDACIDELSRECAALVLEEPNIATLGFVDAETIGSMPTNLAGPYLKKPVQVLKNQEKILEERLGDIVLDIENHLWDEHEDCKGTGVFIPNAKKVEIPKVSKGTGVFIANASYDAPRKRGWNKWSRSRTHIRTKNPGKPTTQYIQVSSKISLPEEWSYECYL